MKGRVPVAARLRRLISEVRHRSIGQVLLLYCAGAWVAYEVILSLTEGLGLPLWVPGFAVVSFLIGLPLVVATAFVQDAVATGADSVITTAPAVSDAAHRETGVAPAKRRRCPQLTWRRIGVGAGLTFGGLALAAGAFMAMRLLGIGPLGTLVAKGELASREPLVVADFDGLTGDSALAIVVSEGLRADLAQSTFVTTADRSRVRETLALMLRPPGWRLDAPTAREVAVRMGVKAVVEGEVGRAGTGYLLTARVVTADSARTLAAFRETAADSTALLPAIERLSRSLRERVGESLSAVRASAPLQQVTTASLPALRKAAEGWWEESRNNRPRAIRLMREAVELDPEFAAAWAGLSIMHYNNGERAASLQSIGNALANDDRLSERQRHEIRGLHATITGNWAAAEIEHGELAALAPNDPRPHIHLSDTYWNVGSWEEAASHAARALELGSTSWVAHWNLTVALLDMGRLEAADAAAADAARALPPESDIPAQLTDLVLANLGAWDSIHARNARVPLRAALADRVLGRWSEADRHTRDVGESGGGGRVWTAAARFYVLGDSALGRSLEAAVDSLVVKNVPERLLAELALILATGGRIDAARQVRDVYLARVPPEVRWADSFLIRATDAFIALHLGDTDEAIAALHEARKGTPWVAPADALIGRAYDLLGSADSAIAAYTRYADAHWFDRVGVFNTFADPLLFVPVHERLAYLHEQAGDPASAARRAAIVTDLWRDADAELHPKVAAIRQLLARTAMEKGD